MCHDCATLLLFYCRLLVFFFKQKTAYEVRISDWSSDVCSSDLLSPWLGHLMVSRTETARALLTPGEVMQLPPGEQIVMAAGVPPIRASKARYYVDPRFTSRILAPPPPARTPRRADDDWTPRSGAPAPVLLIPGPAPDGRRAPPGADGAANTGAPAQGAPTPEGGAPR